MFRRFQRVSDNVCCAHGEPEFLFAARRIASVPSHVPGDIVECGCFRGGSTAKLTILAESLNRRVTVFDSFRGLPAEGGSAQVLYHHTGSGGNVVFRAGDYASTADEVRAVVAELGNASITTFVPGFFSDTMPSWTGTAAAVLMDVDLVESTRDCITHLWPRLSPGGVMLSQDGHLREICSLLTDVAFWRSLGETSPPYFERLGKHKMICARKPLPLR